MQDSLLGFIFIGLLMFLFLLFFGCSIYVYPLLTCWNAPVGKLLLSSLLLTVEHLPTTLLLTALLILTVIGCFCNVSLAVPATESAVDFHHQIIAHAGRTQIPSEFLNSSEECGYYTRFNNNFSKLREEQCRDPQLESLHCS